MESNMARKQVTSGFIYIWRDRKYNRYYVGSHWGTPDDGYVCSSNWMKTSWTRRPEDFKRRIVAWVHTNRKDLLIEEERWLSMIKPNEIKNRYYNLRVDTTHLWHTDPDKSKTIGEKISSAKKGKSVIFKDPLERARRISEGKKRAFEARQAELGYKFSPEHQAKLNSTRKGKTHTDEWKTANSKRMKQQWADGIRKPFGPKDPSTLKPKPVALCKICEAPTPNRRSNFCSKEHRYQAMNATRKSIPGTKWCPA